MRHQFVTYLWVSVLVVCWQVLPVQCAPIRVGILHSQSGTMAVSEKPVIKATLLAIREINAAGGLLGRQLEPVIADGRSDERVFASEAERLIRDEHVDVLFGCWTSASRKAVKKVVEKYNHLLFYPVQYEGLEQSPQIIYSGAAPNQQLIPATSWAVKTFGRRVYLVGSDYIFPRMANWMLRRQLKLLGARTVGEAYLPLSATEVQAIVDDIRDQHPDVILNTINGDSNIAFFHALKQAGITADDIPVVSFSLSEAGAAHIPVDEVAGHYAAWNYFQSLDSPENRAFIAALREEMGVQVATDPMEAAWIGVHLWAQAVQSAHTSDPAVIHHAVLLQSLRAPEGIVSVDQGNRHLWKTAYIGRVNRQRQFDIVWHSDKPIKPMPYPLFIQRDEAEHQLGHLFFMWKGAWSAPASTPVWIQHPVVSP